ncbi:MAG TPA: hemerythrin domain-containing protein [Polyangiales bacterium]|nr:hemerythrin domain-containing protein [Polyangiales bacterium]
MTNRAQELVSKAVGTAKAAKATLEGLTGVFRHLEREHGEVSALLVRLKASSDPDVRRELLPTIRRELLAHEEAEQRALYPALREHPHTTRMAEAHDRDAESLEAAVKELNSVAVDSPHFQPMLERLIERVQHHVREEEDDYFPVAPRVFHDRAQALLERYEQAKAEAMRILNSTP